MSEDDQLERFVSAQDRSYLAVLEELKRGRKKNCWMWFIFPQMRGLGSSRNSRFYGIDSMEEARRFLRHPVLGQRLRECTEVVNLTRGLSAEQIFGPDEGKLKSSATLFLLAGGGPQFEQCLNTYFNGEKDFRTVELLQIGGAE